jgi:glucose/arabinose dehydrogenase
MYILVNRSIVAGLVAACLMAPAALAQRGEVLAAGFELPVDMAADPADPGRFYVVEQKTGRIRVVENGVVRREPFMEVNQKDFQNRGWEQGLLGIAFDPAYAQNMRLYLNYTAADGATRVSRFTATDPHTADPKTEALVIEIEQPYDNHNGGCIRFGPDGMLYIGMGDGGAGGDPHGNGQNLGTLLGKMLRIDVTSPPPDAAAQNYVVPADNPFVGREGARPEIWSYGVRNPWRFSWDSLGRMWIGDVGQNRIEWVSLQPERSKGGENYGWNVMEGPEEFASRPASQKNVQPDRSTITLPIWSYTQRSNGGNGSITGGYFYEGEKIPALKNRYICADFMSGRIWSFKVDSNGKADDIVEHTSAFEPVFKDMGATVAISSFGRDLEGELYMLDHKAGRVIKIVP